MIGFRTGNMFDSSAQCLVNTVNCEGYMGKGIAYQFKERFPENNRNYVRACKEGRFSVGEILFFEEDGRLIANFPTKDRWREKSKYSYIESGLKALRDGIKERKVSSVAIPPLGCGNGGLDWMIVKEKILETFGSFSGDVFVFEPTSTIVQRTSEKPRMSASHLVLMKLKLGLNPAGFGKLRLQNAAYFMNVFSGMDYFRFEKYKFGPYSHSIDVLSGQIRLFQEVYGVDTSEAERILYDSIVSDSVKSTVAKFEVPIGQSVHFVNSIASDKELETAATIVAIAKENPEFGDEGIVDEFLNDWPKQNIERFSADDVSKSIERLVSSGILIPQLVGYSIAERTKDDKSYLPEYV